MRWTECISEALSFIEENITEDMAIEDIAKEVHFSPSFSWMHAVCSAKRRSKY